MVSLWDTIAAAASSQGEQAVTKQAEKMAKRKLTVKMNWQTSPGVPEDCKVCQMDTMDTLEGRHDTRSSAGRYLDAGLKATC